MSVKHLFYEPRIGFWIATDGLKRGFGKCKAEAMCDFWAAYHWGRYA